MKKKMVRPPERVFQPDLGVVLVYWGSIGGRE